MKLISFQIINCFGFKNSDSINLSSSNNLIYVLGRNSSGKSSLLRALRSFEYPLKPLENDKFINFNPTDVAPEIIAEFELKESELDVDKFLSSIEQFKHVRSLDKDSYPDTYRCIELIENEYRNLFQELNSGKVFVKKTPNGDFCFYQESDLSKFDTRLEKITEALEIAKHESLVSDLSSQWLENQIFRYFPKIYIFNEEYSLISTLPNKITVNWESEDNPFLKRFIQYVGETGIKRFFVSNDPDERSEILKSLNIRIKVLTENVNSDNIADRNKELLEVQLDTAASGGIQITVKTANKPSFYSHLSENTKFLFAYHLYDITDNLSGNILLFDEPNNGFHPTAQKSLLKFLIELCAKGNQVIVSTHSEYLIEPDYLESIRLMSVDSGKYLYVKNHFYNQTNERGDFLALQPIFDAIGYKYGNQLEIEKKVIVVEGVTDLLYLRAFNIILNANLSLNVAPARGEGTIPYLLAFLISQGLSIKIIIDTGQIKKKIHECYGIDEKFIYEIPIPNPYAKKMIGSGIEDLFTKNDFKNLLTRTGHAPSKQFSHISNSAYMNSQDIGKEAKRLLAHWLNQNVKILNENGFDRETKENFEQVLTFCGNQDWFTL